MSVLSVLAWGWTEAPRIGYLLFSAWSLLLVCTRWHATRVMTTDKRFLMLFFLLEIATGATSGVLRMVADAPLDVTSWMLLLLQSFLAAYLYYSIPRAFAPGRSRRGHPHHPRRGR